AATWKLKPEKSVSLAVGDSVILNCTVASLIPLEPIKRHRHLRHDFTGYLVPRITNFTDTTKRKNRNFSIHISNVTPADTDTYYCVKFQKIDPDKEIQPEGGTKLYVLGPPVRAAPCRYHGFSTLNITLTWFKNRDELCYFQTAVVHEGEKISASCLLFCVTNSFCWCCLSSTYHRGKSAVNNSMESDKCHLPYEKVLYFKSLVDLKYVPHRRACHTPSKQRLSLQLYQMTL
ncbi:hypothetical protein U0070_003249, partial [Myodes glareolus]